ncbi:hypothetical protein TEA_013124 [Camellia sinensis var. sinensis]|uniref:Uncharacterized protein n=1 Tax=Camellia sinensis var. sinensis TaxID=542762 RepID=A0A4S4D9V6_CAMSN|nr:hypothetical protein TEA_013124 [Camellia sinensis var. sinensis]
MCVAGTSGADEDGLGMGSLEMTAVAATAVVVEQGRMKEEFLTESYGADLSSEYEFTKVFSLRWINRLVYLWLLLVLLPCTVKYVWIAANIIFLRLHGLCLLRHFSYACRAIRLYTLSQFEFLIDEAIINDKNMNFMRIGRRYVDIVEVFSDHL